MLHYFLICDIKENGKWNTMQMTAWAGGRILKPISRAVELFYIKCFLMFLIQMEAKHRKTSPNVLPGVPLPGG